MSGIPAYKLISSAQSGVHLLVDGFQHAKKAPSGTLFFLTHAHSDHYTGIRADWSTAPIYCSRLTAKLVQHLLGVDPAYLRPLPLDLAVQLDGGVEVTLVEANHCPGAVMLLLKLPDGRRIVHTGDFRCSERMKGCPQLAAFRGADALFLDTTYCNPKFRFCLQAESVEYVASTIERLLAEDAAVTAGAARRRRLYLISTYVIGKERVLEAVARRCGVRIHASERKMGVLRCLGFPAELLTADPSESPVHVVQWGLLGETWPFFRPNFKAPVEYAAEHGAAEAVGFVPTGWAHGMAKEPFSVRSKGACSVHLVPYSEHSSYQELLDFVGFMRPRQVIPTVGGDGDPASKETAKLLAHFRHAVDSHAAKANFLKGMASRPPAAADARAAEGAGDGSALESTQPLQQADGTCDDGEGDVAGEPGGADNWKAVGLAGPSPEADAVALLVDMSSGALNAEEAKTVLQAAGGDLARAVNTFLDMPTPGGSAPSSARAAPPPKAATAARPAAGNGSAGKRRRSTVALPAGQQSILTFLGGKSSGGAPSGRPPDNQQQSRQHTASGEEPASPQLPGTCGPAGDQPAAPKRPKLSSPAASASAPEVPSDAVGLPLEQYHPSRDAPWAASQPTPYLHLARTFHLLDSTTKRLKKSDALVNAFRSVMALSPADLVPFAYLAVGRIAPDYEGLELSVGGSTVAAAVSEVCGVSRARLREMHNEMGDMGDVAAACKRSQSTLFPPPPLTVAGVFAALRGLAGEKGAGAAGRRQRTVLRLLRSCREAETKYLVRTLVGALRVGANWRSVVPALARALAIHDAQQAQQEGAPMPPKAQLDAAAAAATSAFHVCPNLELLIAAMRAGPVDEVDLRCPLTPGIPIKPMLAKITEGVDYAVKQLRGRPFLAEYKYDGVRSQIHVMPGRADGPAASVKVYSRNCEDRSGAFPDVAAAVLAAARGGAKSFIIDAEIVAVERSGDPRSAAEAAAAEQPSVRLRPFQELAGRARGEVALADVTVDVCVFVFDVLEVEGRSLLRLPLSERRRTLRAALPAMRPGYVQLAQGHEASSAEAAGQEQAEQGGDGGGGGAASSQQAAPEGGGSGMEERVRGWLVEAVAAGTEGLMLKSLAAAYEPSKRSDLWLKLKKDYCVGLHETLDLVPIGAWWGNGRKAGWFSPFLMAVWDADGEELQSVCRVMSGFSDEFYKATTARLKLAAIPAPRPYYRTRECPDVWFDAREVWEVRGADLTVSPAHKAAAGRVHPDRGLGLRFPRFLRIRADKGVEDATSSDAVERMYRRQGGAGKAPSGGRGLGAAPSGPAEEGASEEVASDVEEV